MFPAKAGFCGEGPKEEKGTASQLCLAAESSVKG
jgi:hypothetical protein